MNREINQKIYIIKKKKKVEIILRINNSVVGAK